jgi:cell division septum initiation protein DivIVA
MSVHINKVMAAANKAADEYLVAIKRMYDEMNNRHSSYELEAQKKAEKIIQNANTKAENIVSDAKKESNEMWESLSGVFKKYCGEKQFSIPEE